MNNTAKELQAKIKQLLQDIEKDYKQLDKSEKEKLGIILFSTSVPKKIPDNQNKFMYGKTNKIVFGGEIALLGCVDALNNNKTFKIFKDLAMNTKIHTEEIFQN